ncbi:ribonuclease Z [soil metagenome]
MTFEVTILGSNSAIPANGRHPTSQILNLNERLFLIDCGEGTQMQFNRYKIRAGKIDHIFISHLHGDHFFGLIGLITSYNLNHRSAPLHVYGPPGTDEIINLQLKYCSRGLDYELVFHVFEPKNGLVIYEDKTMMVTSLEMIHRIACSGFVFTEKITEHNIRKEKIQEYSIPFDTIGNIKKGADLTLPNGRVIANAELTLPLPQARSYAFCTDTLYNEALLPHIAGVNLLYHEATFDQSRTDRALETFHSTSGQAALIAQKAQVRKLIIGHFSSRYFDADLDSLLLEAQSNFADTALALEGYTFQVER